MPQVFPLKDLTSWTQTTATLEAGLPPSQPLGCFVCKVASRCNLDCTYCYEYNMGDDSWRQQPHFMSADTVRALGQRVREHADAHGMKYVTFSFHGGEPLLAGADFFRQTVTILRDALGSGIGSSFGVQTNGTLITKEMVGLFSKMDIGIGLSFDGPQADNDRHRIYANGRGSYDDIMKGARWLQTEDGQKIFRGILCVIDLQADPLEVFETLAALNPPSIDFLLPHGNWQTPPPGKAGRLESAYYAQWYITIFDRWFAGFHNHIRIRTFEEIITYQLGGKGRLETLGLSPIDLICIAADGSIEGVDTMKSVFPGAHKLGLNVYDNSFNDVLHHPMVIQRQIGIQALSDKCASCPVVATCGGGYFPHRYSKEQGFRNPSVYCSDLLPLITHIQQAVRNALHNDSMSA